MVLGLGKFFKGLSAEASEFREAWVRLPRKTLFFGLLACFILLFHFYGNATYGYLIGRVKHVHSLFSWLYNAYTAEYTDDGHGLLIPIVVLVLFYWKRKRLLDAVGEPWFGGVVLVGTGLVLHIMGYLIQQTRISAIGFFVGVYGLMGAVWGKRFLRESFFPYFLFVFCIPLGSLAEPISFRLHLIVTKLVVLITHYGFGIDVIAEGTRLFSPDRLYEYEVAAPCSGIRSLIAILAVSTIYAWISFKRISSKVILIAAGMPLAVIGNVCRLLLIVLAAELAGQEAGMKVHESTLLSLIPYVPAFLGLGLIGNWIKKHWERVP